jgi:hypothetical protein
MIIGPAVTEPEFQHLSFQSLDKTSGEIEAGSLGLQPADKAVEPAHGRSGGDA